VALVPPAGAYVVCWRLVDLWTAPFTRPVRDRMKQELEETALGLEKVWGAPPEQIERLTLLTVLRPSRAFRAGDITLLALKQPVGPERLIALAGPGAERERYQGRDLHVGRNKYAVCILDSRTHALGRQDVLHKWLDLLAESKARPPGPVRELLREGHSLTVAGDVPYLAQALSDLRPAEAERLQQGLEARTATAVADPGPESRAWVRFVFADAAAATAGQRAVQAVLGRARTAIADGRALPPEPLMVPVLRLADRGLEAVSIQRDGAAVVATTPTRTDPAVLVLAYQAALQRQLRTAVRSHAANNLATIARAMHRYAGSYEGQLPTAAVYDRSGKPLLSWRVLLLPFLGEMDLYKQLKLDEPWDSEHNKKLLDRMPLVYLAPGQKPSGMTYYQVFTGKRTLFEGKKGMNIGSIPDGSNNTILVAEAAEAVPWTKPAELAYDPAQAPPRLGSLVQGAFHVAMADGSVRLLSDKLTAETLHRAIQRDDLQALGPDFDSEALDHPIPSADD
jgi:hypothetical protein